MTKIGKKSSLFLERVFIKHGTLIITNFHSDILAWHLLCGSRKNPYHPPRKVFWFEPSLPTGISSLVEHTFLYKSLAFKTPPALPLGISNDLHWGGHRYFLEPNITFSSNFNMQTYTETPSSIPSATISGRVAKGRFLCSFLCTLF